MPIERAMIAAQEAQGIQSAAFTF